MNARPLPMTSAPFADVASLECEIPYAAAIDAARRLVKVLQVDAEDVARDEPGLHLHLTRLDTAARLGHDIEVCGSGLDCPSATRNSLYPAIARLCHADPIAARNGVGRKAASYVKMPGVAEAFPDLVPMLTGQAQRSLATIEFQQVSGNRTLCVPLALVNPAYLRNVEAGDIPSGIEDDFDYGQLRRYCSDAGIAAGATFDEALLQALLAAQEQLAAARFAVNGIALRQRRYLRRVDADSVPEQIGELMATAAARLGQPVHLFDIGAGGRVAIYLACVEGAMPVEHGVAAGAGFSPEHAATRALRSLLQANELTAWKRGVAGTVPMQSQSQHPQDAAANGGPYHQFAIHHLREILQDANYDTVPFGSQATAIPATLAERIVLLCAGFQHAGLTAWYARWPLPSDTRDVACVQVLLAPFDANLLLQGAPVGVSFAALQDAANP